MITKPFVGVLLMVAAGMAPAQTPPPRAACLGVESGWVRIMPSHGMGAGYAVLVNRCERPVTVIGARSPAFAEVSLHETQLGADGVSRMRAVDTLVVPARGRVALAPGGLHLMLMQARSQPKPGAPVPLVLQIQGGADVAAALVVKD